MSSDYTEIVVVLDRSGSMQALKADHEGGLRSFVKDQKELPGEVRFTLIQFDTADPCEVVYDGTPINEVSEISLSPRGGTPLLDAIGLASAHVEQRLVGKTPDQIVVMVITDGEENSSREWTKERVKARIAELEKKQWKFLYLGANVDAFSEAGAVGIARGSAAKYAATPDGVHAMYANVSPKFASNRQRSSDLKARGIVPTSADLDYDFTEQERAELSGGKSKQPDSVSIDKESK